MKKILFFLSILLYVHSTSNGQASGLYNGEITEHGSVYSEAGACPIFKSVYNWHATNGIPSYNATNGTLSMRNAYVHWNYIPGHQGSGVTASYYFTPGQTYIIEFGVAMTSAIPNAGGFIVWATDQYGLDYTMQENYNYCDYDFPAMDPNYDEVIGTYNLSGTSLPAYTNMQMTFTPTYNNSYLRIYPTNTDTDRVFLTLDYVRIRQCGSGVINLQNIVASGNYLKENINAGTNVQAAPTLTTKMTGQVITLNDGFSATPTGTGIFSATAVSTCDMPIGPHNSGKPGRQEESEQVKNATEIQVYPNPTSDFINVLFANNNSNQTTISIINLTGQVLKTFTKNYTDVSLAVIKEKINIASLVTGTYILRVNSGSFNKVTKFVVVR